jgi:hypothetical protein
MKTFADIKRRAVVGATLTMTYNAYSAQFGTALIGKPRRVVIAQTNAIAMESVRDDGRPSWLYWPAAKSVRVTGPDSFDILHDEHDTRDPEKVGTPFMSYRFEAQS